ncbi:MAG: DNA/RNA non-specific endonuclease [Muribaculaceae bacterium]|nr:DNA/RNA non-specific endonuclease [Muribaculaceae bacterium]
MTENSNLYAERRRGRKKRVTKLRGTSLVAAVAVILIYALAVHTCDVKGEHRSASTAAPMDELMDVRIPAGTPEVIKGYTGFAVSFNPTHRVPNYVAWELTGEEARGTVPRNSDFHPDPDVAGCPTLADYRGSGFDRGHMAPAAEMKWSAEAMYDSHVLTNMCPQDRSINGGRWKTIEQLEQQWAKADSALIIITGPILSDEITRTIGNGVSVPERFFRVIFSPYVEPPRAIAFIVPNMPTDLGVFEMAVSVDEVEAATGFDFLSALPDEIETEVERESKINIWRRLR